MIRFDFNSNCCGCGACFNICPTKAIDMIENVEGFKVPSIDNTKCTNCGLCEKVCPHISKKPIVLTNENSWLYVSNNEEAKKKSSSGAAFYELAKCAINHGAYICGCAWDDNLVAEHIVGNEHESIVRIQGSKYVQSDIKEVYREIGILLRKGYKVIFSGVPCQCTAASNYVNLIVNGKYRENLITIAVICHGVASPLAWETFKIWISEKEKSDLIGVNFRDKSQEGYKKSYCRYDYANGQSTYLPTFLPSSKYIEATLVYNLAIRSSCSHCDCKGHNESIDIILGDWYKGFKNEGSMGMSCVVTYTNRGERYLIENLAGLRKIEYSEVVRENGFIEKSVNLGVNRSRFFESVSNYESWDKVEKLYPAKYLIKKLFIRTGLYDVIKGLN